MFRRQVFKARDLATGAPVALKKMVKHHENEGFPRTETREIKILNSQRHPNMVLLRQIVTSMDVNFSGLQGQTQQVISQSGPTQASLAAAAAATTTTSSKESTRPVGAGAAHGNEASSNSDPSGTSSSSSTAAAVTSAPPQTTSKSTISTDKHGDIFLVFEYCDYDLTGLLNSEMRFEPKQIKTIVWQLLSVLDHLHGKGFVHRDIKCSNLLLQDDYTLKLADFGLSRATTIDGLEKFDVMTNNVVTLWYRSPELLLGSTRYDTSVDIWSVGCIIVELFTGKPAFYARTEIEQLNNIINNAIGTPPPDSSLRKCPGWEKYAKYSGIGTAAGSGGSADGINGGGGASDSLSSSSSSSDRKPQRLAEWIQRHPSIAADSDLVVLLKGMLEGDPRRRITAHEALSFKYFRDISVKNPLALLKGQHVRENLTFRGGVDLHEFQVKKRFRDKMAAEQAAQNAGISAEMMGSSSGGGAGEGGSTTTTTSASTITTTTLGSSASSSSSLPPEAKNTANQMSTGTYGGIGTVPGVVVGAGGGGGGSNIGTSSYSSYSSSSNLLSAPVGLLSTSTTLPSSMNTGFISGGGGGGGGATAVGSGMPMNTTVVNISSFFPLHNIPDEAMMDTFCRSSQFFLSSNGPYWQQLMVEAAAIMSRVRASSIAAVQEVEIEHHMNRILEADMTISKFITEVTNRSALGFPSESGPNISQRATAIVTACSRILQIPRTDMNAAIKDLRHLRLNLMNVSAPRIGGARPGMQQQPQQRQRFSGGGGGGGGGANVDIPTNMGGGGALLGTPDASRPRDDRGAYQPRPHGGQQQYQHQSKRPRQ